MAYLVKNTALNASTLDIMNAIRANASLPYFNTVPVVEQETDIPKVGQVILGTPAFQNEFVQSVVNRIAFVAMKSMMFNNPYRDLKKGYLDYGETIEEIFVEIAKVRWFSRDKAPEREFKKTVPDVKAAFHVINWEVQYPVSVSYEDLRRAFLSASGVSDLIAKIIDSVYRGSEYDEYLLFKYLLIKGVNAGEIHPVVTSSSDLKKNAADFRGMSNRLLFPSNEFNAKGVLNNTPRERQIIFMDANYNASFDVEVLASAFNMDKAEFLGKLKLIDSFSTFDNERWADIREESDGVEEVTSAELTAMQNVVAIIVDEEWFQIYDNLLLMTEKQIASGLYWNYYLNSFKTVSWSPFSNAVYFTKSLGTDYYNKLQLASVDVSDDGAVLVLKPVNVDAVTSAVTDKVTNAFYAFSQMDSFASGSVTYDGTDYPIALGSDGTLRMSKDLWDEFSADIADSGDMDIVVYHNTANGIVANTYTIETSLEVGTIYSAAT